MMRHLLAIPAVSLLTSLASAATIVTPCSQLETFAAMQQAQVCAVGDFTAKDFAFSGPVGVPGALTASSVFPSPGVSAGKVSFGIQGNFQGVLPSGATVYTLGYTIDPPPEILDGFEASLSFDNFFAFDPSPGSPIALADPGVTVTFAICAGGSLGPACPDFHQLVLTSVNPTGLIVFGRPTNFVNVSELITIDPGASFSGTSADVTALTGIPEPSIGGLLVVGIALLTGGKLRRQEPQTRAYGGGCNWFVGNGIAPGTTPNGKNDGRCTTNY
ncbi:MAG: hypothetical protein U0Q16_26505 [Bryobacteraceae bacterium]